MKILLVDDEPNIRKALRRLLRDHEVSEAPNVYEACKTLLDTIEFDLVLSDVMMPNGTGADLHRWVLEHREDLSSRFVFMTGGMRDDVKNYVLGTGAPILDKPFTFDEVKEVLAGFDS
jgi:DNA-binding response OmpR family regulator